MAEVVVVNPVGPHQFAIRSGSVHAPNASSRGASKRRVMSISRSPSREAGRWFSGASTAAFLAAMFFLLEFEFLQVEVEAVEAFLPEAAIGLDPVGDVAHPPRPNRARPPIPLAPARDQAGRLAHLQVAGAGRPALHVGRRPLRLRPF